MSTRTRLCERLLTANDGISMMCHAPHRHPDKRQIQTRMYLPMGVLSPETCRVYTWFSLFGGETLDLEESQLSMNIGLYWQ